MGLYLKQEETGTELARLIKADLRRKAEKSRDVYNEINLESKNSVDELAQQELGVLNNPAGRVILITAVLILLTVAYFLVAK